MRYCLLAAATLLLAPFANADTLDYFFNGVNEQVCLYQGSCPVETLEFTLPSNPIPLEYTSETFQLNLDDLHILRNTLDYIPDIVTQFGFTLLPSGFNTAYLYGLPGGLFTGPTSAPTLVTGSSPTELYSGESAYFDGTLTVTDLDTTPTPEPSSWVLLGTGLAGVASTMTQRLRRNS